jgi:serine/threonine-protein kinase
MDAPSHDPMIGRRIENYRILDEIGRGGMGVVYRARDEDLHCDVALKLVPTRTFAEIVSHRDILREVLALARLNHPAVVVVHRLIKLPEFDCIVMEFVAGESLDRILKPGALPEPDALRLGIDIADGLAAAHEAGVIHRDLKPGNLRVRPDGRLKIVDFGLAKHIRPISEELTDSDTQTGILRGTLHYVAPEMWHGAPASEASDLYAAGVVLYEMATGVRPFHELSSDIAHATTHVTPPPPRQRNPAISADFEAVILRCLEKDPGRRFRSASEMAQALQAVHSKQKHPSVPPPPPWKRWAIMGAAMLLLAVGLYALWVDAGGARTMLKRLLFPAPPSIRSLGVLPFKNASGDPRQDYLAEAMAEALSSSLGEYPKLHVKSNTTMRVYAPPAPPKPLPQIGREVGAEGIVEGSVWISPARVRIAVRLFRASEDHQIWGAWFDSDRGDLFDLQSRVARSIAGEIGLHPGKGTGAVLPAKVDSAAYDDYLQGRYQWNRRSDEGVRRAIEHFQRAIDRDSSFALAYSGLADAWATRGIGGMIPPTAAAPVAKRAALKALALNPKLSEVYVSLGNIQQNFEWDWKGAERAYRMAIELKENNAHAHHWYANHLALRGRFGHAMDEIRLAQELDPLSLPVNVGAGAFLYYARRYGEALVECQRVFDQDSTSADLNRVMAASYIQLGREADAGRAIQRWLDHAYPGQLASRAAEGYRNARLPGMLRVVLHALEARRSAGHYGPATDIAGLYSLLRDREHALHWLNVAYEQNDTQLNRLKVDPIFDPLRGDPRFADLLYKVGLAPPARCGGAPATGRRPG